MMDYGPLIKWAGIAIGILAILGTAFYKGMEYTQTQWDAAVMEQQLKAGEFIVKQAMMTSAADSAHQKQLQRQDMEKRKLSQKVREYELSANQKCELSPQFESVADSLVGVRQPAADGLPAAADPPGLPHAEDRPAITDVAVLRFIEVATGKLNACADQANALIDWQEESRKIALEGAGR